MEVCMYKKILISLKLAYALRLVQGWPPNGRKVQCTGPYSSLPEELSIMPQNLSVLSRKMLTLPSRVT